MTDDRTIRPGKGIYGYERALVRAGLGPVAGADEAGRGACAGPLVAAAVILADTPARRIEGLNDSKLLTARQRERVYDEVMAKAVDVAVVSIEADECDRLGMHVADLQALRRAVARLHTPPGFVLTDGFSVDGLQTPGLAMWKGDRVAACVAAASVIAKVTRDRIMTELAAQWPHYDFEVHKGYVTAEHQAKLAQYGPCPIHRRRFELVRRAESRANG
ncbi:ribonuclease HII [Propionibacteriaceae bacterium G1746]|uniref:ribonuclease HII n=1 Tax=Aestuariimicrobium sp. G57 TaxID=3418485 RepID=UPI003C1C8946